VGVTGKRFSVTVGADEVIGMRHEPPEGPRLCVVACHGMAASKDRLLAREFPARDLALARFDFRGSGESGGRYRDAAIGSRIADLGAVLKEIPGWID